MPTFIHPTATVDDNAEIGENVSIGAYCFIGPHVKIGDDTNIHQNVIIEGHTSLGKENQVFPYAVLGTAPQHMKYDGEASTLEIGDRNQIREHVTMHRGTAGGGMRTVIGSHGMFMVGSHIAHDCHVGDHVILVNHVMVGGHVMIDDHTYLGGMTGVQPFVRIGRNVVIGGMSKVDNDVIPFAKAMGNRCFLDGINLIGLERNGFTKQQINTIRSAYKAIFRDKNGTFRERFHKVKESYGQDENVRMILEFIESDHDRPIMQANGNGNQS